MKHNTGENWKYQTVDLYFLWFLLSVFPWEQGKQWWYTQIKVCSQNRSISQGINDCSPFYQANKISQNKLKQSSIYTHRKTKCVLFLLILLTWNNRFFHSKKKRFHNQQQNNWRAILSNQPLTKRKCRHEKSWETFTQQFHSWQDVVWMCHFTPCHSQKHSMEAKAMTPFSI